MNPQYQSIISKCFVNVPWYELKEKYLDFVLSERVQPEIGFEGNCLYDESPDEFERIAAVLRDNNLSCTMHAPFFDLSPGALDPEILNKSRAKLRLAFELLEVFRPKTIVCHLQFESSKHDYKFDQWFEVAAATWAEMISLAVETNIPVMLENTYENSPKAFRKIFEYFDTPFCGFCLDVGHLMAFAKSKWQQWLPELSPWLGQLHLHDNLGDKDAHLAPGRGNFDFHSLFEYLKTNDLHPIITLEPHSEEDMDMSFSYLAETGLLRGMRQP